jgi:hypothetical protein
MYPRVVSFPHRVLNRLRQPVLNLAPAKEQTALVSYPVLGRFPWELAMPLGDLGITSRAQCWRFPEAGRPIMAKGRVLDTATAAALEERHGSPSLGLTPQRARITSMPGASSLPNASRQESNSPPATAITSALAPKGA